MIIKINPEYERLRQQIEALPFTFAPEGDMLHEGRNKVKAMRWDDVDVVVKNYKKPNFFLKLQFAFLYNCKAKKAYKYANLFNQAGLHSPVPVAYAIIGRWPMIKDSYFACLPVEGMPLKEILTVDNADLIHMLARELVRMHAAGLMHGDLNLTNIYIDESHIFRFIDTNRTKIKNNPNQKACAENLMRLTHDRKLLKSIASEYAVLRGWDANAFAERVIICLDAFERKKARLKALKARLGIHPPTKKH